VATSIRCPNDSPIETTAVPLFESVNESPKRSLPGAMGFAKPTVPRREPRFGHRRSRAVRISAVLDKRRKGQHLTKSNPEELLLNSNCCVSVHFAPSCCDLEFDIFLAVSPLIDRLAEKALSCSLAW